MLRLACEGKWENYEFREHISIFVFTVDTDTTGEAFLAGVELGERCQDRLFVADFVFGGYCLGFVGGN